MRNFIADFAEREFPLLKGCLISVRRKFDGALYGTSGTRFAQLWRYDAAESQSSEERVFSGRYPDHNFSGLIHLVTLGSCADFRTDAFERVSVFQLLWL